ncbi:MAG: hypothetical protein CMB68_00675 [Euryarchaeota archaeon]|nr:hypothetical protein [Euryarchaeota archaeon]
MADLWWPAFFLCDILFFLFLINWFFSKPKERSTEVESGILRFLKRVVIAIIVMYAISFLALILLVNYFPWERIGP